MAEHDLFIECFPVTLERIPPLAAYEILRTPGAVPRPGWLARQLNSLLPGDWVYAAGKILTDAPAEPEAIAEALERIQALVPVAPAIADLTPLIDWQPDAIAAAEYVLKTSILARESDLRDVLQAAITRIPNAIILRQPLLRAWEVDGYPAISVSIRSYLLHDRNLQQFIEQSPQAVVGLTVLERTALGSAVVEAAGAAFGGERSRVLAVTDYASLRERIQQAPDEDRVVAVMTGGERYEVPASILGIVIDSPELQERFGINSAQAVRALRILPAERAKIVRTASDVLKNAGLIENAYNSRTHPGLFVQMDFTPSLTFADGRVRPFNSETLAADFLQNGLFARHPRFKSAPITLAVINTLDSIASDFIEAMRRQIERDFGFEIAMIRERNVRVVNDKNIASAVRVVEKENPNAVLAFFPNPEADADPNLEYLRSLTLGKGIASHAIYEQTMHDPDSMALVIMGVLAKTGNVPFALTEPLEFAQLIVGIDVVRERLSRGDRVVLMTRIYRRDGLFMQYFMELTELDHDEPIPFSILQRVFPTLFFSGKSVILHHAGTLPDDLHMMLHQMANELGARFHLVEILEQQVPRLYGLAKQIAQAPWGSTFRLGNAEAFVVTSSPGEDRTAQPLHIRMRGSDLSIEQAVYSVLAWTLLHYGSQGTAALPVTVQHAADLAEWLGRGMLPQHTQGDVPFWL